jgi:hypothetical protein
MDAEPLKVEVEGTAIVVAKPGTDFCVRYEKDPLAPNLLLVGSWIPTHVTSPTIALFRAQAFQAAIAKARELGWIV